MKPVTADAADKIEVKPKTLLADELHLASIDSAVEQTQPKTSIFSGRTPIPK